MFQFEGALGLMEIQAEYERRVTSGIGQDGIKSNAAAHDQQKVKAMLGEVISEVLVVGVAFELVVDYDFRPGTEQPEGGGHILVLPVRLEFGQRDLYYRSIFVAGGAPIKIPGRVAQRIQDDVLLSAVVGAELLRDVVQQQWCGVNFNVSETIQ